MQSFETILTEWRQEMAKFQKNAWFDKVRRGELGLAHYKAFLRETYFNTRSNPALQAFTTAYLHGEQRQVTKRFYQHAISEIGHDQMALNDLKALGEDIENIPNGRPLPSTVALTAFGFYSIQFVNPLCYLGYLFHLEFMPTQNGFEYMDQLSKAGIPREAMTFLEEHAKVDVGHNKLMVTYVNDLIKTPEQLKDVVWATRTACDLHGKMVIGAFESVG